MIGNLQEDLLQKENKNLLERLLIEACIYQVPMDGMNFKPISWFDPCHGY